MTDEFSNGEANAAREQLIRTATRAHRIEVALVSVACAIGLGLTATIVAGTLRLQDYAKTNKALGEQNTHLLQNRVQADQFGILAVRCVLDQFALHRNTNQIVHDHMAAALHVDATPATPLPPIPSDQQVMDDCSPFYRR